MPLHLLRSWPIVGKFSEVLVRWLIKLLAREIL
jgi:hypothetical protein